MYISHGASAVVYDTLCFRSDLYKAVFCLVCGTFAINDVEMNTVRCRNCGTRGEFGQCEMSYVWKYWTSLLGGLGIMMRHRLGFKDEKILRLPEQSSVE